MQKVMYTDTEQLKTVHQQAQLDCLSRMLENNSEYPVIALRYLFSSELLAAGHGTLGMDKNTARIVATILRTASPEAMLEYKLASFLQELAARETESLPLLNMLRRFYHAAGPAIDHAKVCEGLTQDRPALRREGMAMDKWVMQIVDFICLTAMSCIPGALLQDYHSTAGGSSKITATMQALLSCKHKISAMQCQAVTWCHEVVPKVLGASDHYVGIVRKVLFMDRSHVYAALAAVNNETYEKQLLRALFHEVPIQENTATRIVLITISSLPLQPKEALDILHSLVYR